MRRGEFIAVAAFTCCYVVALMETGRTSPGRGKTKGKEANTRRYRFTVTLFDDITQRVQRDSTEFTFHAIRLHWSGRG